MSTGKADGSASKSRGSLVEAQDPAGVASLPAPELMMQMITGYWVTQIVHGAARAGYADHLHSGPMTAAALADASGIDPLAAQRHLRACATLGLVTYSDELYSSTPLLDVLRRDHPASMRGLALSQPAPGHWLSWGRFWDVLKSGHNQTVAALGSEIFDYFARTPEEADAFTESMTSVTVSVVDAVAHTLDVDGVGTVVDVGGAGGALLGPLLANNATMRGVVFDLPGVIGGAAQDPLPGTLRSRVEFVGGDFFEAVPSGDLYLLKWILHDWDDDQCVAILRNCRRSINAGGRIAIIELLLGEIGEKGFAPLLDINMMVMLSGRERTLADFTDLLGRAGFGDVRVISTNTSMSIIEAGPVETRS